MSSERAISTSPRSGSASATARRSPRSDTALPGQSACRASGATRLGGGECGGIRKCGPHRLPRRRSRRDAGNTPRCRHHVPRGDGSARRNHPDLSPRSRRRPTRAEFPGAMTALAGCELFEIGGVTLTRDAARNDRTLRSRGFTSAGLSIASLRRFCLRGQHSLLHRDRDLDPFEKRLGLSVIHP